MAPPPVSVSGGHGTLEPMSGFQTLLADPPWDMKRGSQYSWREGRASGERQELDYPPMTLEEIHAVGVEQVVADDAHLFLWTTGTYLEESFGVLRSWGFRYAQTLVWCKAPRGWAPGGVFQSTVEFCLYGRRGNPLPNQHTVERQWWEWPRTEHSAKPEAFIDMLEEHFPEPRLELFSRRARLGGWSYAGNQALGGVEVEGMAA